MFTMPNLITTDTKARQFNPSKGYFNRMTFILTSDKPEVYLVGVNRLKAIMEQGMMDIIPAHERRWVTRTIQINKAPKESWIRWDYDPPKVRK